MVELGPGVAGADLRAGENDRVERYVVSSMSRRRCADCSCQIEQFIETIFPSQKPPVDEKKPEITPEEAEKERKLAEEAKWDMIYMGLAVIFTITIITSSMVSSLG